MPETAYAPDPRDNPPVLSPDGRTPTRMTYRFLSVTGVAQRVLGVDALRSHALLEHNSATPVFLARSSGVSTGSQFSIFARNPIEVNGYEELWAITSGPAVSLSIMEFFRI